MAREPTPEASKNVPTAEKLKLWVRSGGRCVLCNKYLLEDEFTQQPVNLGELAHNVGRKASPESPRGGHPLEIDKRNLAANLLLLCGDHHRVIDALVTRGDYTVEELHQLKRRHEARIKRLTAMDEDCETVVLRIVGTIRGAATEVSERNVRSAVVAKSGRYPHYGLNYRGADIEIDLRGIPNEGCADYWSSGQAIIDDAMQRVADGVARGEIRHLSIFPLARIPLLAYAGYRLDDKVPTEIFQKQRGDSEDWGWDPTGEGISFKHDLLQQGTHPAHAALLLSLSGTINRDELPPEIRETFSLWSIGPDGGQPNRDIMRSALTLQRFARTYHDFLSTLEHEVPAARELSVFAAVPTTAAVTIGRGVMRDAQPVLRIYDRDQRGSYSFALEINR